MSTSETKQTTALTRLTVPGMGSDHCAGIVRESLQRLDGVTHISTRIASHKVHDEVAEGGPTADL